MSQPRIAERVTRWIARQAQRRVPHEASNPFLEGSYTPVSGERTETRLQVTGTLPPDLDGRYLRIGPNPMEVKNPATYHWFLGDGMVHGIRLGEGRAHWYRNRWVGVDSVRDRQGLVRVPGARNGTFDTVNTNIIGHAGRLWALVEAGAMPVEIDGELNTLRHGMFQSEAVGSFSAHPHRDPDTGELHAICYQGGNTRTVSHVVINANGELVRRLEIPVRHGPMIHDCAITARYVVVLDLPVTFSMGEFFRGAPFPYKWNDQHLARVGLLPRNGSAEDVRWCAVAPCYVFHTSNAYDLEDGRVVLDVVAHGRMFDRSRHGPEAQRIAFERWTLDPAAGEVTREEISVRGQEFPRFDERLTGKPYRYAYAVGASVELDGPQPLLRHDLLEGTTFVHDFGSHHLPGEAVFVPRAAHAAENDGWLMTLVTDLQAGRTDLVILDAQVLGGAPLAIVHLPVRVPLGFHGNWVSSTDVPG